MGLFSVLLRLMEVKHFRGRTGPEDRIAIEVGNMLRAATLEAKLSAVWTHIPHEVGGGNHLSSIRYALAKAMGLITGSADYVFVWPEGGGWIELKSKTGSLSPAQRDFKQWCSTTGVKHAVCRSCEEVEETLRTWGVLNDKGGCEYNAAGGVAQ